MINKFNDGNFVLFLPYKRNEHFTHTLNNIYVGNQQLIKKRKKNTYLIFLTIFIFVCNFQKYSNLTEIKRPSVKLKQLELRRKKMSVSK